MDHYKKTQAKKATATISCIQDPVQNLAVHTCTQEASKIKQLQHSPLLPGDSMPSLHHHHLPMGTGRLGQKQTQTTNSDRVNYKLGQIYLQSRTNTYLFL
jgi:hypothetical protein